MSPSALGLALAAFSAPTTAIAHTLIKSGKDKLAVQAWVRLFGVCLAGPLALWVGLPPGYLWPWLIAAAIAHGVYQALLSLSYSVSDFSVAYPIARGSAPILTAIAGVVLLGDTLGPWLILAISIVSAGIVMLGAGGRVSRQGLILAVATGMLTTAYSVIDARGMRLSPDLLTFIAWFLVLDAIAMPGLFMARRGHAAWAAFRLDWKHGLAAGIMTPICFVPALFAFKLAPVAAVSAIRESSVLFGMLIAGRILGEAVDVRRLFGAALITGGIAGIIAGSAP